MLKYSWVISCVSVELKSNVVINPDDGGKGDT
jgi:hypothetical protein